MNKEQLVAKSRSAVQEVKARPQFVVMSLAAIALLLWVFISSSNTANRADRAIGLAEAQQVLIDKLAVALDEARAQGAVVPAPEVIAAAVPDAEVSPAVGATGERGEAGAVGTQGDIGLPGSQGDTGATGATGAPGATGSTGTPGADGAPGATGEPGVGVAGPEGPPGPAGTDGAPGANGADGAPGAPGTQGPPGPMPSTMQCTPTNPLDLGEPWTCTTTS